MKRAWLFLSILALPLVFVTGCGDGKVSEKINAGKKSVFRYPIPTNPTKLDPALVQDGDTIDLLQQVFEGLVAWGTNNEPVPNLAEKWDISPDGKAYTFHLKKGVKFTNGRELEASDFKFSIERSCRKDINSETAANYLDDIVGASDMIAGQATEVKGVKVIDKGTLDIDLVAPRPYFLSKLTYSTSYVVAKEAVGSGPIEKIDQMIGTGPYIAKTYDPNQIVILEANPNYHGGKVLIQGIERPVITDGATRLNKFKSGEVDLVALERQDLQGVSTDSKLKDQIHYYDRPAIYYIGFNFATYKEFADLRVRKAFAMAIDRKKICDETLGGVNKLANCILPPGVMGHRDEAKFADYDPAAAKKLLADAGYPDGKGLPPLEMYYRNGRKDIQLVVEAAVSQLKANLGVTVQPHEQEWGAYLQQHNAKKHDFFHMRWMADFLDPQNFLSLMLTTKGNENKIFYSNPKVDALCAAADQEQNRDKRLKMYADAEDLVLGDVAWIPIYFQRDIELINPRVKGLRESLFGHLPHTTVTLE